MIYIVTAMYAEAHAFIKRFRLKKDISNTRFQVFRDHEEGICLVISGTGTVPAAVAVTDICTAAGAGREDFLINAGICAGIGKKSSQGAVSSQETGKLFLCNRIREKVSGRTFYPDILYRHRFEEAQIVTGAEPYRPEENDHPEEKTEGNGEDFYLYDMEAAAVYQAGAYYLGPHQMSFLKVVSDDGDGRQVTPEQIERLMDKNIGDIADYIAHLQAIACSQRREEVTGRDTAAMLERLCADLHCSKVMSESLRQHIRYFVLSGTDFEAVIEEMYRSGELPCRDKRDGKRCFEELKRRLL